MGVAWTNEQRKVIDLRNRNILVSAAAGSGKTAVLVERIITMLTADEDPVSVDELLIVTFTEAAAAEMKERIRNAIEKKLEEEPDNEHLKQQATLIHNALITTIHSFCLSVIRDHFHVIDLDPGFRVGEEGELKLLQRDVLGEILEDKYQEGTDRFLEFVEAYAETRSDKKLEELILRIYEFSRSDPDGDGWMDRCVDAYRVEELESCLHVRLAVDRTRKYLRDACKMLEQALELCMEKDGPGAYEENLKKDLEMIRKLARKKTYRELQEAVSKMTWARLAPNRSKTASEVKTAYVKEAREEVKRLIAELKEQYFSQVPEEILRDLKICCPAAEELADLVRQFGKRYEEAKQSRSLIDFSDMEQYALRILTEKCEEGFRPSSVAKEYQKQFLEIMVDEYQDSNLIQETILASVSRMTEGIYNMFMVGDVKQSIYRFRLSRPELFLEKFHTYSTDDGLRQRIDLHKNFRSRKEVLDSVNRIFAQLMADDLGGIAYDDQAALYPGADYPPVSDRDTEVLIIDCASQEAKGEERKLEARTIAAKIRQLRSCGQVTDRTTGQLRAVRYSDIVILTRSIRGFADAFAEELNREGIPAHTGTKEGYFAACEIGVILDYLRILDNPRQDVPLTAVLASPIGNMRKTELASIRSARQDVSFYEAAWDYQYREDELAKRLNGFWKQLEKFREMVSYTPIHELLWRILDETGYGDYAAAMPGGEQRSANLEMLVEKARSFEAASYKGLFHFIRYMEQLQKYDVDYGEANVEDEQSDTVRIMTIHKSKGLEFPVVFVAGMGKRFNMQDARAAVVMHVNLGIGLDAVRLSRRTRSASLIKKVIQKEEALDSLGEELRVLYVALTRAKEKLIITGTLADPAKKLSGLEMLKNQGGLVLPFARRSKAVTFWDWILPALARLEADAPVKIRIITPEEVAVQTIVEDTEGQISKEILEAWNEEVCYDTRVHQMLKEQFSYEYPYRKEQQQKMKFTVSELKKRIFQMEQGGQDVWENGEMLYEEPEVIPLIPHFLKKEQELTGASRGTAYHRVMELLDFSQRYDVNTLKEKICQFREKGRIDGEMAGCIQLEDILTFLRSSVGMRMSRAADKGRLYREQPFVLGMDARHIYPTEEAGEMLLVQGIIDAYFEEDEELVVLDYKTDRVYSEKELADKYHGQLDYYARALERMTQKKVKEKIIYSFTMQKEIRLP